jgi:hypothetical protein
MVRRSIWGLRQQAICADSDLMKAAGATWYPDMNKVSEFVAILLGGSI